MVSVKVLEMTSHVVTAYSMILTIVLQISDDGVEMASRSGTLERLRKDSFGRELDPGGTRREVGDLGGMRREVGDPGGTRREVGDPGGTRREVGDPGGTRREPVEPGGTRGRGTSTFRSLPRGPSMCEVRTCVAPILCFNLFSLLFRKIRACVFSPLVAVFQVFESRFVLSHFGSKQTFAFFKNGFEQVHLMSTLSEMDRK